VLLPAIAAGDRGAFAELHLNPAYAYARDGIGNEVIEEESESGEEDGEDPASPNHKESVASPPSGVKGN
jgi:hypothetical protein